MPRDRIESFLNRNAPEMVRTLSRLVAIPTVNPPGRLYRRCVDYLSGLLREWRVAHEVIPVSKGRYPRFCILGGVGDGKESLHLHGHYDVVPAYSAAQFDPQVRNSRLYGRGSSDMKSGIVSILYALKYFQENRVKIGGRITFSLVPDEETGSHSGAGYLDRTGLFPRPSFGMLMPEPTSGAVWYASKGALTIRVTVKGKPAHVALAHQGKNAFEAMTDIARSLSALKETVSQRETALPVDLPGAKKSVLVIGGESGSGVSFNIVPDRAFFTVDRRFNPEEKLSDARKELMQVFDAARSRGIAVEADVLQESESSTADPESPLAIALGKTVTEVKGEPPPFELCPGTLEIRFFNNQGIPAMAYGPGLLEVSHGPEEYVGIPEMLDCTNVYIGTALRLFS